MSRLEDESKYTFPTIKYATQLYDSRAENCFKLAQLNITRHQMQQRVIFLVLFVGEIDLRYILGCWGGISHPLCSSRLSVAPCPMSMRCATVSEKSELSTQQNLPSKSGVLDVPKSIAVFGFLELEWLHGYISGKISVIFINGSGLDVILALSKRRNWCLQ